MNGQNRGGSFPDRRDSMNRGDTQNSSDKIKNKITSLKSMSDFDAQELVDCASDLGHLLAKTLRTNQLRKFLSSVAEVKVSILNRQNRTSDDLGKSEKALLIFLIPQLAYAAARQSAVIPLYEVIEPAIKRTDTEPAAVSWAAPPSPVTLPHTCCCSILANIPTWANRPCSDWGNTG